MSIYSANTEGEEGATHNCVLESFLCKAEIGSEDNHSKETSKEAMTAFWMAWQVVTTAVAMRKEANDSTNFRNISKTKTA